MKFLSSIRILTGVLACGAAAPCVEAVNIRGQSGPTLRDLTTIRLYSVPEISIAPPVPLPDPADGSMADSALSSEVENSPDIPYDFFWDQGDSGKWRQSKVSDASPGLRRPARRMPRRLTPWLPAPSQEKWTFGSSNWRYAGEQGLDVTLGNTAVTATPWGTAARLGGVSVSQASRTNSNDAQAWRYSMSVGALDYSADQTQGDLEYGPTAGNTVLSYQLSPQLTLQSQLEMAPELFTTGIGGQYKTREWGAWSAGVARATYGLRQGWSYQTAYTVDVMDDLQLSWVNESRTAGYADLSRYQDASAAVAGVTQRLTATVPMGRWGDIAGTYESSRTSLGDAQHNFGITQQFWYSPNLRIGLQAQRELVTGDYDVGIRFSVPIN